MKKRYVFIAIIIAIFVFSLLIWRFQKLSISNVISIDAASISDVSAGAMITDFKSGKISAYRLNDDELHDENAKEILRILDSSEYRRDFRNLLPWGVGSLSSDNNYDGRTLMVSFSGSSHFIELHFMSISLMSVIADETNMHIYHPLSQDAFDELIEYIQSNGVEQ